ncbi:MAG: hypothetical protein GX147_10055 [Deltaproteobacteria bacterium]|nr:hypothetical protein [Deltaproteobacteria bacterium]
MKKHCHGRRQSQVNASCGFALAETIIALLILSIALLAIAIVPIMSSKMALQTVQKEQALALAHTRLDVLEAASADIASLEAVGIYTVSFDRSFARGNAVVEISWGGITQQSTIKLERDLSRNARLTAVK